MFDMIWRTEDALVTQLVEDPTLDFGLGNDLFGLGSDC